MRLQFTREYTPMDKGHHDMGLKIAKRNDRRAAKLNKEQTLFGLGLGERTCEKKEKGAHPALGPKWDMENIRTVH